jgi:hypothetical protein
MSQKISFYDELKYDDLFTVRCTFVVEDDEKEIEALMKELIDDTARMDSEELTCIRIRLFNTDNGSKVNRTYVVSQRDPYGDLCGKTKHLHRFDRHDQLHTVGARSKWQRESRYDPTQFRFQMYDHPLPYQHSSVLVVPPSRKMERIKLSKTANIMHPSTAPYESQVRTTLSFTNDYKKNLTKAHLITNANAITCALESKVSIVMHSLDSAYQGKVMRVITRPTTDSFAIHYFKVVEVGEHNHFNVVLSDDLPVLKNWASKKHLPTLKELLCIA